MTDKETIADLRRQLEKAEAEFAEARELDEARRMGREANTQNHCGYSCPDCGSFWTMTGYGKEWHEPWCKKAIAAKPEGKEEGNP